MSDKRVAALPRLLVTYADLKPIGIRYSRQHIARMVARGTFPRPIKLGSDANSAYAHWRYSDILAWINARAAASGVEPIAAGPAGDAVAA